MKHFAETETRSAVPLETRDDDDGNAGLAEAIAAVGEIRAAVTGVETRTAEQITALTARLDAEEVRRQRPGAQGGEDGEPSAETRAFIGFVRTGIERLGAEEARALVVSDDTAGGYLAPNTFEAELQRELVEISPLRSVARVTPVSSGGVIFPKRTGRLTGKWVGETETRTETEPTYGQAEIPVHEIACYVDVSNRLLEDAAINIESELAFDLAEEFGRLEGDAFVNGNGVKKPLGIMSDPDVPTVLNGHATTLNPDKLITLMYDLPAAYRNNGSWLLNGASIAAVRLFKDTSGRYLWNESLSEGEPASLLGHSVYEAGEMDDIGANAYPIAFGDFGAAYRILDRIGLAVLRDPYTQQTQGLVRFHARRRVGGSVVRPTAIRKLKMATS